MDYADLYIQLVRFFTQSFDFKMASDASANTRLKFNKKVSDKQIQANDAETKILKAVERHFKKQSHLAQMLPIDPTTDDWAPLTEDDIKFKQSNKQISIALDNLMMKT